MRLKSGESMLAVKIPTAIHDRLRWHAPAHGWSIQWSVAIALQLLMSADDAAIKAARIAVFGDIMASCDASPMGRPIIGEEPDYDPMADHADAKGEK